MKVLNVTRVDSTEAFGVLTLDGLWRKAAALLRPAGIKALGERDG